MNIYMSTTPLVPWPQHGITLATGRCCYSLLKKHNTHLIHMSNLLFRGACAREDVGESLGGVQQRGAEGYAFESHVSTSLISRACTL